MMDSQEKLWTPQNPAECSQGHQLNAPTPLPALVLCHVCGAKTEDGDPWRVCVLCDYWALCPLCLNDRKQGREFIPLDPSQITQPYQLDARNKMHISRAQAQLLASIASLRGKAEALQEKRNEDIEAKTVSEGVAGTSQPGVPMEFYQQYPGETNTWTFWSAAICNAYAQAGTVSNHIYWFDPALHYSQQQPALIASTMDGTGITAAPELSSDHVAFWHELMAQPYSEFIRAVVLDVADITTRSKRDLSAGSIQHRPSLARQGSLEFKRAMGLGKSSGSSNSRSCTSTSRSSHRTENKHKESKNGHDQQFQQHKGSKRTKKAQAIECPHEKSSKHTRGWEESRIIPLSCQACVSGAVTCVA